VKIASKKFGNVKKFSILYQYVVLDIVQKMRCVSQQTSLSIILTFNRIKNKHNQYPFSLKNLSILFNNIGSHSVSTP
jgi:hypothetical protein